MEKMEWNYLGLEISESLGRIDKIMKHVHMSWDDHFWSTRNYAEGPSKISEETGRTIKTGQTKKNTGFGFLV